MTKGNDYDNLRLVYHNVINSFHWRNKMISIKRLNNKELWLNPHLIETIEATPDTVITLTTGKRMVVIETVPVVIEKIIQYRRKIGLQVFSEHSGTT